MSGRGLPINKERTNLGDTQEDWSPHSTQPMRKWGGACMFGIRCSV